jgi:hypothetical protein
MELTREVLIEIVKSLRSNAKARVEKRKRPRVGMRLKAHILRYVDEPATIWVRDVSSGGIAAMSNEPMKSKDNIKIIFPDADADPLPCTVTYSRKVGATQYQIGLKFDSKTDSIFA